MIDVNRAPGSTERNFVFTFGATEYNTVNKMIIIIRVRRFLLNQIPILLVYLILKVQIRTLLLLGLM